VTRAVVVIPWWDSGSYFRRRNLRYVMAWYEKQGLEVVLGSATDRGAARNEGASRAKHADVLVFGDGDLVTHDGVALLIETARETGKLVHGYTQLVRLTEEQTRAAWRNEPVPFAPGKPEAGLHAMRRSIFEAVGGYPELPGLQREDMIFNIRVTASCGPQVTIPGYAAHLWHEDAGPRADDDTISSLYYRNRRDPNRIRALTERHR